jgi:hypothetical protein
MLQPSVVLNICRIYQFPQRYPRFCGFLAQRQGSRTQYNKAAEVLGFYYLFYVENWLMKDACEQKDQE